MGGKVKALIVFFLLYDQINPLLSAVLLQQAHALDCEAHNLMKVLGREWRVMPTDESQRASVTTWSSSKS